MAEELLQTHSQRIAQLTLVPSSGGRYEVTIDGELVHSKAKTGAFPETEEIRKKLVAKLG